MIFNFAKYYAGDKMKKDHVGGKCDTRVAKRNRGYYT